MATTGDGLAATRDRRSNAGARMARLLQEEDEDDFYKTTYGGFNEVCKSFELFYQSNIQIKLFHPNINCFISISLTLVIDSCGGHGPINKWHVDMQAYILSDVIITLQTMLCFAPPTMLTHAIGVIGNLQEGNLQENSILSVLMVNLQAAMVPKSRINLYPS